MIGNDRRSAFLILKDIEQNGAWSNLAINSRLSSDPADSPAFVRELVYGVLRNAILLDHNIDRFLARPAIKRPERILLRMGFYQIAFMDSVTGYAAVNETVELAKSFARGRERLINAVLRNFIRDGGRLSVPEADRGETAFSFRPWIADLWREAYGEDFARELMRESCVPADLTLRVNTLKCSRDELAAMLPETAPDSFAETAMIASGGSIISSEAYGNGYFSVQSRMSQYAVQLLDPRPGELLIDMCAAPGGKSCCAAERMENRGRVIAFDLYEHRARLIDKEAERLGITIIESSARDASEPIAELRAKADRVLCDVPCSGLGTIRRKPEIKLREKPKEFEKLPDIQAAILRSASETVMPGGRLMYSTCTINPAENEDITQGFLRENISFEKVYERQFFPQDAGDGFYICLMERKD